MKLWTFQRDHFNPAIGPVVPSRSKFAQRYPNQYQRLWEMLETDQIVWCVADRSHWTPIAGEVEWQFDVPDSNVLAIVDEMVWAGLLGLACSAPKAIRDRLYQEAASVFDDINQIDEEVESQIQKLRMPAGDPWEQLFLADPYDPRASVLIRCPIAPRFCDHWVAT